MKSLSARRAWIEIHTDTVREQGKPVALRKESVDRNDILFDNGRFILVSLSARRAWIEISIDDLEPSSTRRCRSPQGERG